MARDLHTLASGIVLGAIIALAVVILLAGPAVPRCFEDEVAVWDGERHSICVPLDDLQVSSLSDLLPNRQG